MQLLRSRLPPRERNPHWQPTPWHDPQCFVRSRDRRVWQGTEAFPIVACLRGRRSPAHAARRAAMVRDFRDGSPCGPQGSSTKVARVTATATNGSQSEAAKLRAEIAEAEAKVKGLEAQIRHREGRLRRMAADAYNQASASFDGMTADTREIRLGSKPCVLSPIGICAYSRLGRLISIPGQLGKGAAWDEACRLATTRKGDSQKWTPARTNACLFCGQQNPEDP